MAEIPGLAWCASGAFIGIASLFLGFIRPVEYNAFFKLMFIVGIGMVVFGFFKIKIKQKSPQQEMEERRQQTNQRGVREIDIDIDDYRRNPQLRQQAMQGASSYNRQNPATHYGTPRNFPQQPQQFQQQQYPQQRQPVSQSPTQQSNPGYVRVPQHQKTSSNGSFCSNCGSPLLKHHKYCPICGGRV
jgi:hypothetical protein